MKTDKFAVGEVVNSDGQIGSGVNFEVVKLIEGKDIQIKLTEVDEFWSERGLSVNQECILEYHSDDDDEWWIFTDRSLPWFILSIDNGVKTFTFYR